MSMVRESTGGACLPRDAMAPELDRTVLVVDDDVGVLNAVGDLCALLGYRVFRALDGAAALKYLPAGIDLLITDVQMPHLNGTELLQRVRGVAPALPVIAMTGYGDTPALSAMRRLGLTGVLQKPFAMAELKALIPRARDHGGAMAPPPPAAGRRILVVDDDAPVRDTLALALESRGHTVTRAEDGRAALRCLHQSGFDLVFLDVLLPEFDGASVLRALRKKQPDTPVVLVTGHPDHEATRAALAYGPVRVLAKPIGLPDLEAVLGDVFKG